MTTADALAYALRVVEDARTRPTVHTHWCPCCDRPWTHRAACTVYRDDDPDDRTWTDEAVCASCARGE